MQNKLTIFSGQGIGPVERFTTKLLFRQGLKNISLISAREKTSFDSLLRLGVQRNRIYLVGDDALTISSSSNGGHASLPKKFIALNIRLSGYSFTQEKLLNKFSDLVKLFVKNFSDCDFVFIPISYSNLTSDYHSAEKIINLLKDDKARFHIYSGSFKSTCIKDTLKKASMAIGVSYHFCLFSLSLGIPTAGLYTNAYYKQKLSGLMGMFNIENAALDLRNASLNDLYENILGVYSSFDKENTLAAARRMEESWYNFMRDADCQIDNAILKKVRICQE